MMAGASGMMRTSATRTTRMRTVTGMIELVTKKISWAKNEVNDETTIIKIKIMAQRCFASISETGLHCARCVTREAFFQGAEIEEAFCEKHNKPCQELGYYCSDFIGYKPDYRMTDEEEQELVNELRSC